MRGFTKFSGALDKAKIGWHFENSRQLPTHWLKNIVHDLFIYIKYSFYGSANEQNIGNKTSRSYKSGPTWDFWSHFLRNVSAVNQ